MSSRPSTLVAFSLCRSRAQEPPGRSSARRRRSRGRLRRRQLSVLLSAPAASNRSPRGVGSVREGGDGAAQFGRHAGELVHGGPGLGERLGGGLGGGGDAGDVAGDL